MERGRGTTIATIVMAGLLMRPTGTHTSENLPATNAATSRAALKEVSGDGPWKASCRYWQQERALDKRAATVSTAAINEAAHDKTSSIDLSITVKKDDAPDCEGALNPWGAPADPAGVPEVKSLIALVPVPVHTHLALPFDRHLDMLLEAAADNYYWISYSWLPWKTDEERRAAVQSDASGGEHSTEDQPGLLIFDKRLNPKFDTDAEKYMTVVPVGAKPALYIFLIGETPADGVNSKQLERAIRYQSDLHKLFRLHFSSVDTNGDMEIIGPTFSGSAASLNETLRTLEQAGRASQGVDSIRGVSMAGATETRAALDELDDRHAHSNDPQARPLVTPQVHRYISFSSSETDVALSRELKRTGYNPSTLTDLREDATVFGGQVVPSLDREVLSPSGRRPPPPSRPPTRIFFPREISLLRNTYKDSDTGSPAGEAAPPTPYLHLSTRDPSARDTIPHYSKETSPPSQEAQLMSIAHALGQQRTDFVNISASNVLDELFLSHFLHRSNPDIRILHRSDLLFERETDNAPYIGSLSITPYPLAWPGRSPETPALRPFPDSASIGYYNAASYMVWRLGNPEPVRGEKSVSGTRVSPVLYNYSTLLDKPSDDGFVQPSLWLTTVGNDAYYPVAVLPDGSGITPLPQVKFSPYAKITVYPSHLWQALCAFIAIVCLIHIVALFSAHYTSQQTCDLDLRENEQVHRRALYILCGGVVLFLLSAALTFPLLVYLLLDSHLRASPPNIVLALVTVICGLSAAIIALSKTFHSLSWEIAGTRSLFNVSDSRVCAALYWVTAVGGLGLALLWWWLCWRNAGGQHLGMFFSYRCLHPDSGVSPVTPVLFLLWGWYFWAITQARRLRFSTNTRPRLPNARKITEIHSAGDIASPDLFFVSDHRLRDQLVEDLTCLMILHRMAHRVFSADSARSKRPDAVLIAVIVLLAAAWFYWCPIKALDHFGWWGQMTTAYEFFLGAVLVPFLVLTLCAALRLFFVWNGLKSEVLEVLEWWPPRFAFSRLKDVSWVSMLREGDLLKRRRDMARAMESVRQLAIDANIRSSTPKFVVLHGELEAALKEAQDHIDAINEKPRARSSAAGPTASMLKDKVECLYASCAEVLLEQILIPHWRAQRRNFVQSKIADVDPRGSTAVHRAEEFLALRYLAFIRAVMVQIRYLMVFITVAFVLIMLALNSYPFQPRQAIDVVLTGMLLCFGVGTVLVFAQMHRDAILSRITNTKSNELGLDFFLRIAAFGALPVLTWLATQYPEIGGRLYTIIRPGIDVMK